MSLSLFIARRIYHESNGGKQVSHPAVLIIVVGIAIGLVIMIIAVVTVIRFRSEVRNKVIGFGSHIQITNPDMVSSYETHPIVIGGSMITAPADYPEISHAQRFSTKPGMIRTEDVFQGAVLEGVGPEFDPHFVKGYLVEGEVPVFNDSISSNQVLISKALVTKMKPKLGDKIHTHYVREDIHARRLTIAGIYRTNFLEYDNLSLLTSPNLVNRSNGWQPERVTGVELQVKDYDKLGDTTYEIAIGTNNQMGKLGGMYYARNIEQLNPQIFAWLDLLDLNVWVILFLMIGMTGFTMISGLLTIIIERTNMIDILKVLRANNFTIRRTFLRSTVFLVGKGMFRGNAIDLVFYIFQSQLELFRLDPEIYYVDTVPVSSNILSLVLINLGTLLASILVLIGPSLLITKINPANSTRYE